MGPEERPPVDLTELVARVTLPITIAIAALLGLSAMSGWLTVLRALHGTAFGTADPIFGRDVAYYVFSLPLVTMVLGLLFTLPALSLPLAAAAYWLRREVLLLPDGRVRVEPAAGVHLAALGACLFLVTAARIWLVRLPELLYSTTGPLVGASYTDLHATRPGLYVAAAAAVLAAAVLLLSAPGGGGSSRARRSRSAASSRCRSWRAAPCRRSSSGWSWRRPS